MFYCVHNYFHVDCCRLSEGQLFHHGGYKLLERSDHMNQDDIILLGELLDEFTDDSTIYKKYENLIKKAKIVSQQAKASKEYQELMDKLNNDLSDIGKDDKNGES